MKLLTALRQITPKSFPEITNARWKIAMLTLLAVLIVIWRSFSFAHNPCSSCNEVVWTEDITQQPYEPEPIDIYSNDDIERDNERVEREIDDADERIRQQLQSYSDESDQ